MDRQAVLAAFDEQIRRGRESDLPNRHIERHGDVVRSMPVGGGWTGVTWSDLSRFNADTVIAAQINQFAAASRPWEWKHYSYDQPADLPDRLLAAGFTPQPAEALLVAELCDLVLDVAPPAGVQLRTVGDQHDVEQLVAVHDTVFGGGHAHRGAQVLAGLSRQPTTLEAVVAFDRHIPIAGGRVEFHLETDFASLWGGGTVAAWRGRGVFRSVVAHRAAAAAARGFRYLQVDASPDSQPILRRLGFVELATTTPFTHPGTTN